MSKTSNQPDAPSDAEAQTNALDEWAYFDCDTETDVEGHDGDDPAVADHVKVNSEQAVHMRPTPNVNLAQRSWARTRNMLYVAQQDCQHFNLALPGKPFQGSLQFGSAVAGQA